MPSKIINNILYFSDNKNYLYPVRCEKKHLIEGYADSETSDIVFRCRICQRKYSIIEPQEDSN